MNTKEIHCIGLVKINETTFVSKVKFEFELSDGMSFTRVGRKKVYSAPEWFVKRQAFETVNDKGEKIFWYDNDKNMIIKVSKYGQKKYRELKQLKIN